MSLEFVRVLFADLSIRLVGDETLTEQAWFQ